MDPLVISLVSACTALVASILGPVVALVIAKRQINANIVSSNRKKWIESLRDLVAELLSQLVAVLVVKTGWKGDWAGGLPAIQSDRSLLDKLERIVLVQSKIRLLINPGRGRSSGPVPRNRGGIRAFAIEPDARGGDHPRHRDDHPALAGDSQA